MGKKIPPPTLSGGFVYKGRRLVHTHGGFEKPHEEAELLKREIKDASAL